MKKYKVKDSKIIVSGESAQNIVQQLNDNSLFGYQADLENYMKLTAEAIKMQYSIDIDCSDYARFIEGLIANSLLIENNFENVV